MGVRFLMYHGIYNSHNEIFGGGREWIPESLFEEHCNILHNEGYQTIQMRDYYKCIQNNQFPEKAVVISFDDGALCQLQYGIPILEKYNFSAIFYLPVLKLNKPKRMNDAQIHELIQTGMEIGSHSMSHGDFRLLNENEVDTELSESKKYLEDLSGQSITHFSYPYGYGYKNNARKLRKNGYQTAVTVDRGINTLGTDLYALFRLGIYNHTNHRRFLTLLSQKHFYKYYFLRNTGFLFELLLGAGTKKKLYKKIHMLMTQPK